MHLIIFYYYTILQIKVWIKKIYNVFEIFSIPWYKLNNILGFIQNSKLYYYNTN